MTPLEAASVLIAFKAISVLCQTLSELFFPGPPIKINSPFLPIIYTSSKIIVPFTVCGIAAIFLSTIDATAASRSKLKRSFLFKPLKSTKKVMRKLDFDWLNLLELVPS
ncbi:hypothetical protein [Acinetobacter courvalinii]|uniref:Uncharacterized protein n=1 Tax=Acinetobacter courvalinii TaxID=280147 RepID=A0AA42I5C1_9GAMM|nr:hypothetical protein [Acinetobacter courvalinii]MDH0562412.1 hypothetical protein [Acinetobacter courvalinii]